MHVVFITNGRKIRDSLKSDGGQTHLVNLLSGLISKGVECSIIAGVYEPPFFLDKLRSMGIKVDVVNFEDLKGTSLYFENYCRQNIDIIHLQRMEPYFIIPTILRYVNIPVVYTMHIAFYPEDVAPEEMLGLKRIISKVTNKIDRIIAISNAAKDTLIQNGVREEKITTIYNGNVDRYSITNSEDDDIPVVGFVGRLSLEKGPDILIDSIRIIKERTSSLEFKVCIVGDGSMEQALKDKVLELKLEKMVEFKGYSAEPYREMNKFRVMVVPSRSEGLGLVILEAMNLGIPVIGAMVGGIPEAVIDGETGLLVPNEDPDALAIAIELLLKDAEKCQKFGKQARRIWEEKFSLDVFTNNHLDLYQSLINEVDKSVSSGKK